MFRQFIGIFTFLTLCFALAVPIYAQSTIAPNRIIQVSPSPAESPSPTPEPTPIPTARPDLTQETEAIVEPLRKLLDDQVLGSVWPSNPIKYAIRGAVEAGVPINTLVLLLLLPGVAAIVAGARHLVGIRGFGILMPAALSVVFVAIGPVVGVGMFMTIVVSSTLIRFLLRISKIRLQYLPRMSLILLFVVLGVLMVLFAAPLLKYADIINVSIFPILFLVLLAEDFTRVQLGKSINVAVGLTTETLLLSLVSYMFLTTSTVQTFALLRPELFLLSVILTDIVLGKYVGLRFLEYWRFRKLILRS
jgi:hypothetical protein